MAAVGFASLNGLSQIGVLASIWARNKLTCLQSRAQFTPQIFG
jgi:hypothetical protein